MERILIDKSNLHLFTEVLSSGAKKKILDGQEVGIGIVANTADGDAIPAGALSFYIDEPFVRVTWVYVLPQWRQTGFGSELLRTAIEGFLYDDDRTVQSVVAAYPENVELDAFFTSCGFELLMHENAVFGQTTLADGMAVPLTNERESSNVVALPQLKSEQIATLLRSNPAMRGVLEPEPTRWVDCYLPASHAFVINGVIMGLLLFSARDNALYLEYAYSHERKTMALPALIERARKVLAVDYPPETPLYLATTNATANAVVAKLLGNLKTTAVRIAELDFTRLLESMSRYSYDDSNNAQ